MFGCCIAGRPLQTNLVQVDDTHAYFELPNANSINHLCVFSTVPFPDGLGATVHLFWPGKGFQLLGMLSNEKPSAIFRLRPSSPSSFSSSTSPSQSRFSSYSQPLSLTTNPTTTSPTQEDVTAILGISIDPLSQITYQLALTSSSKSQQDSQCQDLSAQPAILAERIVKHLLNYISSFVGGAGGPQAMIPMAVVARWYESFLAKVRAGGIGFLEREE